MRLLVACVELCSRRAAAVVVAGLVSAVLLGNYAQRNLAMDTETESLVSADAPWRKVDQALDAAFPSRAAQLLVLIDGRTIEQADAAAAALAERLQANPALFKSVSNPAGLPFFRRNGLLFSSRKDLSAQLEELVRAQPMIGMLAADPSARGVFSALRLSLEGVERGETTLEPLARPLGVIARCVDSVLDGAPEPLSWQTLLTDRVASADDLRRVLVAQPVLDPGALEPGAVASAAARDAARALALTPEHGVRVRLTGPVALTDEEFASLLERAGLIATASLTLLCVCIYLAVGSIRLVFAVLATLVVGAIWTGAFAAAAIGTLNLISVAFGVLFSGLAVDFGIQFSVRYRDCRHRLGELRAALRAAGEAMSGPLPLAAATTAVGFYAFVPSSYLGVRELGLIAGTGMLIALFLNFTLLPALIALLRPGGEPEAVGFAGAAGLDRFLARHARAVLGFAAFLGLASLALLPLLSFDFDPLHLKNPRTESMSALLDLMENPDATPYAMEILEPSLEAANALGARLDQVAEVDHTMTLDSFVPDDQPAKLALLEDTAFLLGPTLTPSHPLPPPGDDEVLRAAGELAAKLRAVASGRANGDSALALAQALERLGHASPAPVAELRSSLVGGLAPMLDSLRLVLSAGPVTRADIPSEIASDWITPDGRALLKAFPKGDGSQNVVLRKFVAAVRSEVPMAGGAPVVILESAKVVVGAFRAAGAIAFVAISLLLLVTLRRALDVALVIAPLVLAALLTLGTSVLIGLPLNFANVIALPLLLGIGVAFDIYFVANWRAGLDSPLQSSTARAIQFSGLATGTAFGALAVSSHTGTSEMGTLLVLSLAYTLICTLFVLPSLLAVVPRRADPRA